MKLRRAGHESYHHHYHSVKHEDASLALWALLDYKSNEAIGKVVAQLFIILVLKSLGQRVYQLCIHVKYSEISGENF